MGQDVSKLAAHTGGKMKDALDRVGAGLVERLVARREREEERRRERAERAERAGRRGQRYVISFLFFSACFLWGEVWFGMVGWCVLELGIRYRHDGVFSFFSPFGCGKALLYAPVGRGG